MQIEFGKFTKITDMILTEDDKSKNEAEKEIDKKSKLIKDVRNELHLIINFINLGLFFFWKIHYSCGN